MTRRPTLVLAAHGTRDPAGPSVLDELAAAVTDAGGVATRVAYVDVIGPTVADVLAELAGPVVVVPAFLAGGYHVRVDLPRQVAASGRTDVTVAPFLGPDERLLTAVADRLTAAGWRHRDGDAVVLAAAGSSDSRALADVDAVVRALPAHVGVPVSAGYVATATPTVPNAVRVARDAGAGRVAVASWLLAPGLFQRRLADAGADVVAEPLGAHPAVVAALVDRFHGLDVSAGAARLRGG